MSLVATYLASIDNIVSAGTKSTAFQLRRPMPLAAYGALFLCLRSYLVHHCDRYRHQFYRLVAVFGLIYVGYCLRLFPTLVGRIRPENAAYATVLFPIVALAYQPGSKHAWRGRTLIGRPGTDG